LKRDNKAVQDSKTSDARKKYIRGLIEDLKDLLSQFKSDLSNPGTWVSKIAPKFAELTPLLDAATDQGACRYQGGCFVSTKTQCEGLGGTFKPGVDCQNNPL